jgi:hypothetical protein
MALLPRTYASTCLHLAKADIRALERVSNFLTQGGQMPRKKCVLRFHTFSGNACSNRSQVRGIFCKARVGLLPDLAGVLDGGEGFELDVVKFAVDPLDLTHIDVLHNVARVRID